MTYIIGTEVSRPAATPSADLKNEDVPLTLLTSAQSERMIASDVDGDRDVDEDGGRDAEHENQGLQASVW